MNHWNMARLDVTRRLLIGMVAALPLTAGIGWSQNTVLGAATGVGGAPAATSPSNRIVAFVSNRADLNSEIYLMNLDGSNVTRLTYSLAEDTNPALSRDGARLAFVSERGTLVNSLGGVYLDIEARRDIYVMNTDTSGLVRATSDLAQDDFPAWSPKGDLIAFYSERGDASNPGIYVMNPDGTGQRRLTSGPVQPRRIVWNPSGTQVLYRRSNADTGVVGVDGTGERVFRSNLWVMDWSEDGARLLAEILEAPVGAVYMRADLTGTPTYVANMTVPCSNGFGGTGLCSSGLNEPSFTSADGSTVVRTVWGGIPSSIDLYHQHVDGLFDQRLTKTPQPAGGNPLTHNAQLSSVSVGVVPAVQAPPSQGRIAFEMGGSGIHTMDAAGWDIRLVMPAIRATTNGYPDVHAFHNPSISPDGRFIAAEYWGFISEPAYLSAGINYGGIATFGVDGTGVSYLTRRESRETALFDVNPDWSPDGSSIVYTSNIDFPNLWVIGGDGSGARQITKYPRVHTSPSWGQAGVAMFWDNGQVWGTGLGIIPPLGLHSDELATDGVCPNGFITASVGIVHVAPEWSPDGTKLIFATRQVPQTFGDLPQTTIRLREAGSITTVVSNHPEIGSVSDLAFGPSGQEFLMSGSAQGEDVFIASVDGTSFRRLTFAFGQSGPAPTVMNPSWGPSTVTAPPALTWSIFGQALNGQGGGVSGATVKVQGPSSATTTTVGSFTGYFYIQALPSGTYTITIEKMGETFINPSRTVTISLGDRQVDFTQLPPLVLTSISPTGGDSRGGTKVTIKGTGFSRALSSAGALTSRLAARLHTGPTADRVPATVSVTIGGQPATNVTVVNDATITAVVPALPAGAAADVTVVLDGESASRAAAFTPLDVSVDPTGDLDDDGLTNAWEVQFSLDPFINDASADPDHDGLTNAQEFQQGTHPDGVATRFLAEGAVSAFFNMRIALANPGSAPAAVLLRFLKTDGSVVTQFVPVAALARATVDTKTVSGMASAEFSTVIESDVLVVVDRTMSWDAGGYGSHAETSIASAATTWYLAEGATHSGFDLFYLIQNPNLTSASVEVKYLLPAPAAPITKTYSIGANSRFNIWVDSEAPELNATDVSAILTSSSPPIIVERAMYLNTQGRTFGAGHNSAGVTSPATSWFLAEGATGAYFDLFVLIANPSANEAQVTATYLLPSGETVVKSYTVAGNSRFNIWVDLEDARLSDTAVSTTIRSTNDVPVIVERAMWWPGSASTWHEAHNSPGSTVTGTKWALAEGELGGTSATETYILIANASSTVGSAKAMLLFEDGTSTEKTFTLSPNSRFNIDVQSEFPSAAGRRFGAVIESLGSAPAQIVVERAMYSNAGGVTWEAGTNALATRLQ